MLSSIFKSIVKTVKPNKTKKTKKTSPKFSPKSILKKTSQKTSPKTKKHSVQISDTVDEKLYTPSPEAKCTINNGMNIHKICPKNEKKIRPDDFPCKKKTPNVNGYAIFNTKEEWEEYLWLQGKIKLVNNKGKLAFYQGKLTNKGMKSRKNVIETLREKSKNKKKQDHEHFLEDTDFKSYFEA